jgi:predicted alpha/beta superfamily hydrolase
MTVKRSSLGLAAAGALGACAASDSPPRPAIPLEHLPALAGQYFPIRSAATGGQYHIYIRHPEGYRAEDAKRYPVVYLLDGDSTFPYLASHHLFLTIDDQLPEAVVVGIAYGSFSEPVNRRGPDFGEGAAAFQAFLKRELIPTVERRVRAEPARRILVGQSRGGGFVLYSAYTDPDLFWGRIASNPSFPNHRALLFGQPASAGRCDLRLAVASGTGDRPTIRAGAVEWLEAQAGRPAPWQLRRIEMEGGTHAADLPNAYRQAMRWLFGVRPS